MVREPSKVKRIKNRWINREYDKIAIKHKGNWVYYERVDNKKKEKYKNLGWF